MAQIDPEILDKVRALSAYDFARLMILMFGDADTVGFRLLGKKSDATFEVINYDDAGRLEVWDPKVGSLISYTGTTTADGAALGATLIDGLLAAEPDFDGNLCVITSGAYAGQARDINGVTTGGTITPASNFGGQIVAGVTFTIFAMRTTPVNVAAILTRLGNPTADILASFAAKWGDIARSLDLILGARWDGAGDLGTDIAAIIAALVLIEARTTNLSGEETVATHAHADNLNWQTVFTLATATRRKVHSIWLNFVNLTQNMSYRLSYDFGGLGAYVVFDSNAAAPWTPADDDGVIIECNFVLGHNLRLELQSAVLEGAARDIPYELYPEAME